MIPIVNKTHYIVLIIIFAISLSGCTSQGYTQTDYTLVDSIVGVPARSSQAYSFVVPSQGAYIHGDYTAFGGSGNDIEIFIFDENNYINWFNGNQGKYLYYSGQTTIGNIAATLPAGKYYLVYSNKFSVISSKNVKTSVSIRY